MKKHTVSHLAVSNTGLLNFVTGSRLLYGMSRDKMVPAWLDAVHPRTQTPHRAILVVWILALGLALTGTLSMLASTTNVLLLIVFATVNVALVVLRLRQQRRSRGFRVPLPIPVLAAVACAAQILFAERNAVLLALGIVTCATRVAEAE